MSRSLLLVQVALLIGLAMAPFFAGAQNLSTQYFQAIRQIGSYAQRGRHDTALELVRQARSEIVAMKDHPVWTMLESGQLVALGKYPEALLVLDALRAKPRASFLYPEDFAPSVRKFLSDEDDLLLVASLNKSVAHFRLDQREEGAAEAAQAESRLKLWTGAIGTHFTAALELAALLADVGQAELAEKLLSRIEGLTSVLQVSVAVSIFGSPVSADEMKQLKDAVAFSGALIRGNSRFAAADHAGAWAHYQTARESSKLAPYHGAQLRLKARSMHALNRLGRHGEVPEQLPAALYGQGAGSARAASTADMVDIHAELGAALLALGRRTEAIAQWRSLVDGVEQQRGVTGLTASQRQAQFSRWIPYYRLLAQEYVRSGEVGKAFEMVELSKSRLLLETITSGNADSSEALPEARRAELKDITDRLGEIRNQALTAMDAAATARLQRQESELSVRLQALRQQLFVEFPRYAAISRITTVSRGTRQLLPDGTAFVSYMVVPRSASDNTWRAVRILAFVLRGDGGDPSVIDLGLFDDLDVQATAYLSAMVSSGDAVRAARAAGGTAPQTDERRAGSSDLPTLARRLSERLIVPLLPKLADTRTIVFSTDGPLSLLSLEALPVDGQPLVRTFDVTYVQSLSVLALLKQRQIDYEALQRRSLLAMGAAHYEVQQAPHQGGTPTRALQEGRDRRTEYLRRAGAPQGGTARRPSIQLQNLPGTEQEIREVSALFTDSAVYLKDDATESKLQELDAQRELANYRYLLFSAHGRLDTEVPELSALVLGQVGNPPGIDGFITAAKWPRYTIRSDLTVLSACETGTGKVVYGEGVMGLPYALYVAGNRSTALSLWEVDDEATARFMKTFFSYLKAGKTQGEAINATKRDFLSDPELADPMFWASFVLYGT